MIFGYKSTPDHLTAPLFFQAALRQAILGVMMSVRGIRSMYIIYIFLLMLESSYLVSLYSLPY